MYLLKAIPEDFLVREIHDIPLKDEGRYSYYLLKKKDYTTLKAVSVVAERLGVKLKYINFSGSKDRNAFTEQYISISQGPKLGFETENIKLTYLGKGDLRLNLGTHTGNYFEIVARNLEPEEMPKFPVCYMNYFDSQRFGSKQDNHTIGKLLVKKDYATALPMIANAEVKEHLAAHPKDYVGALRRMQRKELSFYINAYQSFLWNSAVGMYVQIKSNEYATETTKFGELIFPRKKIDGLRMPVYGFDTEFSDKEIEGIYGSLLSSEGVSQNDFINRHIVEISQEGKDRNMLVEPQQMNISSPEDDELNPGKKKIKLCFSLGTGSYATMVIRQLFLKW